MHKIYLSIILVSFVFLCFGTELYGQNGGRPDQATFTDPETSLWLGGYGTFRLSDKFFWAGEFHFRRTQHNGVPFLGRMAQLYNRHGIQWIPNKRFSAVFGGVLRFDFTPEPGNDDFKTFILEPRLWHEYTFVMPFSRFNIYHRLRFEHRWSKTPLRGDEYIYRNRYRYKFLMKIPLNSRELQPGTVYFSPDIELILQSGSPVIDNPMEDLRLFPALSYIYTPQLTFSGGMMYTIGQESFSGAHYGSRWIMRFNVYMSFDFRSIDDRVPELRY